MDFPQYVPDAFSLDNAAVTGGQLIFKTDDVLVSIRRGGLDSPMSSPILKKCRPNDGPNRKGNSAFGARRVRWDPSTDTLTRNEYKSFYVHYVEQFAPFVASVLAIIVSAPCVYYLIFG